MTASSPLVCRRCGYTNVPGDTFCGSCGAFLEWEGEQAGGAPGSGGAPLDPDVPAVRGTGDRGPVAPDPAPYPVVDPVTAPYPGPGMGSAAGAGAGGVAGDPGAGLIRCPACGIANAAGRTFCQSCGAKLGEGARVAATSREQIEAAVNAPNRPVQVTTTTIKRPGADDRDRGGGGGGGGVLKWIAVMAILGLLIGAGVVVVGNVLKGSGPGSTAATNAPSAGTGEVSPGTSVEPASEPPSEPPATAKPTEGPKPERLSLQAASASSAVSDKFVPAKAIDGDPNTCWQEGADTEKGQWIEVVFAPAKVTSVILTNGYNASKALYRGNRRLKDIEVKVGDAAPVTIRLKDTSDPQKIDVKNVTGAVAVRITILSTYPSVATSVEGTPFDDAALDEIVVMGIPGT